MILSSLANLYDRLADDPNVDLARHGFSQQKVAFAVVLNPDGTLFQIQPVGTESKGKRINESMVLLGSAKPSGSGINPCLLWDNMAYMLGYKVDDEKPERTLKSFEAFRDKHIELEAVIDDEQFGIVCKFLKSWSPASSADCPGIKDIGTGFGVFKIRNVNEYVHNRPKVLAWWKSQSSSSDAKGELIGQCLVTGESGALARLHEPKIKGVVGAQSAGASIVAFNFTSVDSYGKQQSFNSPVSESIAFKYANSLNYLLASRRRFQLGDTTVIYWTEKPSPVEDIFGRLISDRSEDSEVNDELQGILKSIVVGGFPAELDDPNTPFYMLGLSPNASRISIRFWHESTVKQLTDALASHFRDLTLVHSNRDNDFPLAWQLLRETARETKDIAPLLAGGLMRAMLDPNVNYPSALYQAMLRRMRADRRVAYLRCAVLKAYLNRSHQLQRNLDMALDEDRPETAYHLGRLFAALEKTQEDALKINDTIKDRFYGAASATPASVFPRLIRLSQHHVGKLEKKYRIPAEKRFQAICGKLDTFPSNLDLTGQGLFALGYYHQRQDFFTKKTDDSPVEPTAPE